ncbi:MAG: cytidine deaminase [Sulfobacillus acidophilus]|uniref:Cytidine deaminase n=1 Tax=Sulfobacillus acidophilus TaxID=53633 RepID=A0A2T2WMZ9_9FIRM|nr:MAG: cytidine deaminase [Sulfobacillus acidophilus]
MNEVDDALLEAALKARLKAYAPYSNFYVGAALLTEDGTIVTGANVENASYPLGCCAERTAVFAAVAQGYRKFTRIVIVGPGPQLISPCGACRQVLAEFGDLEVVMAEAQGRVVPRRMRLFELLPLHFGQDALHGV